LKFKIEGEDNIEYYHEYMRLYIANVVLTNQLKELLAEKNDLLAKLNRLEVIYPFISVEKPRSFGPWRERR
jgi:hypothetical protein